MTGGLKPLGGEAGDAAAVKAVERVAHCHQLKVARGVQVFGSAGPPFDVSGSSPGGEGFGVADRLLLLVDCEDIGEVLGKGEGHPARPTRQVEEPAGAAQSGPDDQVVDQDGRIGNPVAVVVAGRPLVQIGPELGRRFHLSIIVPTTRTWQHPSPVADPHRWRRIDPPGR